MSQAQTPDPTEHHPLSHPAVASVRLFDYPLAPGDHLVEFYNALWKACDSDFPYAPTRVARLMPRGHGKTESAGVVFPTWAILRDPRLRVAVISKTKGLAAERTEKVVEYTSRHAARFDVAIADESRTQLTTEANTHKEPTLSPYGLESQLTGKHFDVIIYDDIADWDNQRTETQRRNVRQYFGDYVDNLGSTDSVLPNGPVQAVIGTRKHPQDIYETDILHDARWDTRVYTAIDEQDWRVVEGRRWQIRGDDGDLYDSVGDLPPDVSIAPNGVEPTQAVDVLWPDQQPPEALLYDIVEGDSSVAIWRRENQQDPDALSGTVFESDWLIYEESLPTETTDDGAERTKPLTWVGGLDIGQVDDPQKAVEGDSDYTALAIIGVDHDTNTAYLDYLPRERGLSTKGIRDWVVGHVTGRKPGSRGYELAHLYVEQNAGRGPGQRLRDETHIPAENVSSTGDKESRIHNMAADFEDGTLRIVGDPSEDPWADFEQNEWLQFPTAAHDDRLDAIELAMRAVSFGNSATSLDIGDDSMDGRDEGFADSPIGQAVAERLGQSSGSFEKKW